MLSKSSIHDMFLILAPGPPFDLNLTVETVIVNGIQKWKYTATWEVRKIKHILRTSVLHIFGHY